MLGRGGIRFLHKAINRVCTVHRFAAPDVTVTSFGIIGDDLLMRHSGRKPSKHVCNCDTHAANNGPAATLSRLDCYDLVIGHGMPS